MPPIATFPKSLEEISTISREVKRHGGPLGYSGLLAVERAWRRARRPKQRYLLEQHLPLRDVVITKLSVNWSPQQISGWLKKNYPSDVTMHISNETIYGVPVDRLTARIAIIGASAFYRAEPRKTRHTRRALPCR